MFLRQKQPLILFIMASAFGLRNLVCGVVNLVCGVSFSVFLLAVLAKGQISLCDGLSSVRRLSVSNLQNQLLLKNQQLDFGETSYVASWD